MNHQTNAIILAYLLIGVLTVLLLKYRDDSKERGAKLAAAVKASLHGKVDHVTNRAIDLAKPPGTIEGKGLFADDTVLITGPHHPNGVYRHTGHQLELVEVTDGALLTSDRSIYRTEKDGDSYAFRNIFSDVDIVTSGRIQAREISDGSATVSGGVMAARRFEDGVGWIEGGELH